jgi:hypothetical protein
LTNRKNSQHVETRYVIRHIVRRNLSGCVIVEIIASVSSIRYAPEVRFCASVPRSLIERGRLLFVFMNSRIMGAPWLCATTVSLLALSSCASPSTQQPPWEGAERRPRPSTRAPKGSFCCRPDLADLWRDQDKREAARNLVVPIYGWFTQGFDTLDLKQAKALLDELHV